MDAYPTVFFWQTSTFTCASNLIDSTRANALVESMRLLALVSVSVAQKSTASEAATPRWCRSFILAMNNNQHFPHEDWKMGQLYYNGASVCFFICWSPPSGSVARITALLSGQREPVGLFSASTYKWVELNCYNATHLSVRLKSHVRFSYPWRSAILMGKDILLEITNPPT